MEISDIPLELTDKIFQIKFNYEQSIEKITSYFPLSEQERLMINSISGQETFSNFNSIFSDTVTVKNGIQLRNKSKNDFKMNFLI